MNLIKIFYENELNFIDLQIHSVEGDQAIDDLIQILNSNYTKVEKTVVNKERISDGKSVIKVVPKQDILTIDESYAHFLCF